MLPNNRDEVLIGIASILKHSLREFDIIARFGGEEFIIMMYLSLSFDHRVVDGAQADKFLITIRDSLEDWEQEVYEQMPSTETGFGGVW